MPCRRDCGTLRWMQRSSRHSSCATGAGTRPSMSAGRFFIPSRRSRRKRSGHRLDDAAELVEDLADLAFAHDQWRAERERIADGAEHHVVLEEAEVERVHASLAHGIGPAGQVDADREADGTNVEHVREAFET